MEKEPSKVILQKMASQTTPVACELWELKRSYDALQKEWDYQQEKLIAAEEELQKLKFQLLCQSQYSASLGATLGNLIWQGAKEPKFSEAILDSDQRRFFMYTIGDVLLCFMETYAMEVPPSCTNEAQFILSLVGGIANIAASAEGRRTLSGSDAARELFAQFINVLPVIPVPSGNTLKKEILTALYNFSINKRGLRCLQDLSEELIPAIGLTLRTDCAPEPRLTALQLLQSLTFDVASPVVIYYIDECISLRDLHDLTKNRIVDDEAKDVIRQIEANLERARQRHGLKGRCPTAVPFDGCSLVRAQGDLKPSNAEDKPWQQ